MGRPGGRAGDGCPAAAGRAGATASPAERSRQGQDQGHQRALRTEPQTAGATQ